MCVCVCVLTRPANRGLLHAEAPQTRDAQRIRDVADSQKVSNRVRVCVRTEFNDMVNRLTHTVNMNVDAMKADRTTWAEQFRNALNVNGGDVENASNFDYVMHFLTFFWKVCAALIYATADEAVAYMFYRCFIFVFFCFFRPQII